MTTTTTSTHSTAPADTRATLGERLSATIYDPILWLAERRGMRGRRRELLSQARGRTVEIGGGTGLNLAHYPQGLEELVLAEPDAGMRGRLRRRAARTRRPASVIDAGAELLPFEDGSVDTVVSTLVLCTVEHPRRALREIARVLAPDGQLLFIEHVRAGSRGRSWLQDRLAAPWAAFASGCRCNRPTLATLAECGFEFDVGETAWRGMPSIVKPLVYGRAAYAGAQRQCGREDSNLQGREATGS
jgi:SAM-dependent methyltransferase